MIIFLLTFGIIAGVVLIMALGSKLVGRPLQGSCGGILGACVCKAEGKDPANCPIKDPGEVPA